MKSITAAGAPHAEYARGTSTPSSENRCYFSGGYPFNSIFGNNGATLPSADSGAVTRRSSL